MSEITWLLFSTGSLGSFFRLLLGIVGMLMVIYFTPDPDLRWTIPQILGFALVVLLFGPLMIFFGAWVGLEQAYNNYIRSE